MHKHRPEAKPRRCKTIYVACLDFTVKRVIRQIRLPEGRAICEEKMRGFFYYLGGKK
jgi:hypothetical protein